jgi:hypothetical protein
MSRTLDMIAEEEFELAHVLEEMGGEITDDEAGAAVEAWLAALGEERDAKLTNYARFVRVLDARAQLKDEEIQRLRKRAQQDRARAKWMRDKLLDYLAGRGIKKHNTGLYELARVRNGGKRPVIVTGPIQDIPDPYLRSSIELRFCPGDLPSTAAALIASVLDHVQQAGGVSVHQTNPDLLRIREAIERGDALRFAELGDLGERLEIR